MGILHITTCPCCSFSVPEFQLWNFGKIYFVEIRIEYTGFIKPSARIRHFRTLTTIQL